MMKRIAYAVLAVVFLAGLVGSVLVYPELPERVPVHWGASGEPDGWGSRWGAAFGMPLGMLALIPFMLVLPRLDPRWKNIRTSETAYLWFMVVFTVFMTAMHGYTLLWGLGHTPSMNRFIGIAIGLLFIAIAVLMTRFKQNYTIGFRTSWALADEVVWARTQRFGAIGFAVSGVLAALAGIFLEDLVIWFILVPVLIVAVAGSAYSYLSYRRLHSGD